MNWLDYFCESCSCGYVLHQVWFNYCAGLLIDNNWTMLNNVRELKTGLTLSGFFSSQFLFAFRL